MRSNTGKNPTRAPRVAGAGKWSRTHGLQPPGTSAPGTLRTTAANRARFVVRPVLGRAGTPNSARTTAYDCSGRLTTSHRPICISGDTEMKRVIGLFVALAGAVLIQLQPASVQVSAQAP